MSDQVVVHIKQPTGVARYLYSTKNLAGCQNSPTPMATAKAIPQPMNNSDMRAAV